MSGEGTIAQVLAGEARWSVTCADCLDVLPTLGDKSVAHVITDPPYSEGLYLRYRTNAGALRETKDANQARQLSSLRIGAIDKILHDVAGHVVRVTSRWWLVFHDMEIGHQWREAFGLLYVRTGIWVKPAPMPQISGDRPGVGYEPLIIGHAKGRKRWNGGGKSAVWTHNSENSMSGLRAALGHPCPKPESLMLELVELFTDPGDVVLDPFCGSGTTGVACLRLDRRFIGVERDEKYAATSIERLRDEENGQSLREARAGQLPMFGTNGAP